MGSVILIVDPQRNHSLGRSQQAGPAIWSTEGPACVRPFTVAATISHDDGYVWIFACIMRVHTTKLVTTVAR